jgi:hypothetical protein
MPGKQENAQQSPETDVRVGGCQASSQVFHQDSKNECQDTVEEPATAQVEEETTHTDWKEEMAVSLWLLRMSSLNESVM